MNSPITFSIVVPVHNSEPYLPELLDSLDQQTPGGYSLECVFVDDGSTDHSQTLIRRWLEKTHHSGVVLAQENRGVSSARNLGLESASGDWVGFPDSDDFLGRDYFSAIARSITAEGTDEIDLISSNVIRYFEATGRYDRAHNLAYKFRAGTVLVDLDESPEFIQSQAASAMFRRRALADNDVRFIAGLHAAEDALFVADYLLALPRRRVLCVAEAEYVYRRRAAANSAVDRFRENPDFYFGRFKEGYLPLFERAHGLGPVPQWLANLYLYDLRWFFPREQSVINKARHLDRSERADVIDLVSRCLQFVDERSIVNYRVTDLSAELRYLLLALKGGSDALRSYPAKVVSIDSRCVEVRYLFTGDVPDERVDGPTSTLAPLAAKTRQLDYFSQNVLKERVIRIPRTGTAVLTLAGHDAPVSIGEYDVVGTDAVGQALQDRGRESAPPQPSPRGLGRRLKLRLRHELASWRPWMFANTPAFQPGMDIRERRHTDFVKLMAKRPIVADRFARAWVFMDGVESAEGDAELLYWHVRERVSDANAWFVIREGTADWARLNERGARLVAYGSIAHKHLLAYAHIVFSSQAGPDIVEAMPNRYYSGRRPWRFVCLQDPVDRGDRSIEYNAAPIDLLTTATACERDIIVRDGSPYALTDDSVRVTGSPKLDAIRAKTASVSGGDRNLLIIAPDRSGRAEESDDASIDTDTLWSSLITAPELRSFAAEARLTVVFALGPESKAGLANRGLSTDVQLVSDEDEVRRLLPQSAFLVTDYSSMDYEAIAAGARVAYFRPEPVEPSVGSPSTMKSGVASCHPGPVASSVADLVALLAERRQPTESSHHHAAEGEARNMPIGDGRSCARILDAARELRLI